MKKKSIIILAAALVIIVVAIVLVVFFRTDNGGNNVTNDNNKLNDAINKNIKVTGKLQEYIASLQNNYYIKYYGKFKDNNGDLVQAVVEYTKDKDSYAFRSSEINMYLVCKGNKLYSISNRYKLVMEMPVKAFDTREYNLASDIGQLFVSSYKENIGSTEYDVEEYIFNGKIIKYYFNRNDIKLIKYNGEEIRIIRLEKNTNKELFVIPNGYSKVRG